MAEAWVTLVMLATAGEQARAGVGAPVGLPGPEGMRVKREQQASQALEERQEPRELPE